MDTINSDLQLIFLMSPVTQIVIFAALGYVVGSVIRGISKSGS